MEHSYEECIAQTHPCFKHKVRFWREQGLAGVCPPAAERDWGGPTVREQARDFVDRAKVNGYNPEYVGRKTLI